MKEETRKIKIERKLKITKKLTGVKRAYGSSCARSSDGTTCSVRGSVV